MFVDEQLLAGPAFADFVLNEKSCRLFLAILYLLGDNNNNIPLRFSINDHH
jgi:hypothetical protein